MPETYKKTVIPGLPMEEVEVFWLKDILNVDYPLFRKNKTFDSYEELFSNALKHLGSKLETTKMDWTKKEKLKHIIGKIVYEFWMTVMDEILVENNSFVFPYSLLGKLYITDLMRHDHFSQYLPYSFICNGRNFYPVVDFNEVGEEKIASRYYVRFSQKHKEKLRELIKTGHKW